MKLSDCFLTTAQELTAANMGENDKYPINGRFDLAEVTIGILDHMDATGAIGHIGSPEAYEAEFHFISTNIVNCQKAIDFAVFIMESADYNYLLSLL